MWVEPAGAGRIYAAFMRSAPTRTDLAPGVVLAGLGLMEIWLTPTMGLSAFERAEESVVLLVISVVFVFRRRWPTTVSLVALALLAVSSVSWTDSRAWTIGVLMFANYSAARHAPRAGALMVLAASVAFGVLVSSLEESDGFWMYVGNLLFLTVLLILFPWAAGLALRRRQEWSTHEAARAVEQERLRIARELHDAVGHALGVIVVQAEGERAQLSPDASESTRETLTAIAQTGRFALDDVRKVVQVMRTEQDPGPQPGLGDLARLLDGMTAAGLPTVLDIEGEPRPLPPALDLSAYRVVQEALTNTLRHSRDAHSHVLVRYAEDAIDIEITDDGHAVAHSGARGFGLVGMRERVALFGGSLEAGPRPGGGFAVRAHLPAYGGMVNGAARPGV